MSNISIEASLNSKHYLWHCETYWWNIRRETSSKLTLGNHEFRKSFWWCFISIIMNAECNETTPVISSNRCHEDFKMFKQKWRQILAWTALRHTPGSSPLNRGEVDVCLSASGFNWKAVRHTPSERQWGTLHFVEAHEGSHGTKARTCRVTPRHEGWENVCV